MQQLSTLPSQLIFAGSQRDERKVVWCTFITGDGEELTIGLTSERFVGFREQYGCDLQRVCRLALEQSDQWPTTGEPYQIEGRIYLRLETALKNWEFKKVPLTESTISSTEQAIDGLLRHLNRRFQGENEEEWEYFYTDQYAPEAYRRETKGLTVVFRRRTKKSNR
jgi:hypothetical protein